MIALIPLFLVLGYLFSKGVREPQLGFFTRMPTPVGQMAAVWPTRSSGTFELVGNRLPDRRADRSRRRAFTWPRIAAVSSRKWCRFSADVMMGIPSIVIGIFVYAIFVRPFCGFSTLAGAIALAIIMIPLVTRTSRRDDPAGAA